MLSYQHSYHAGNLADVHKHALLAWMLAYLTRKDKPLSYIETHAGRGLYDLSDPAALKTGEAASGITRVQPWFDATHPLARAIDKIRHSHGPQAYPGSPLIAATLLRATDTLHLAEMHPQEHAALQAAMVGTGARCHHQDGFALAHALTPPSPRRGLMLIDPSYEVKSDYADIPGHMRCITRAWNVGIICLWYPILTSRSHQAMLEQLQSAHEGAFRHEVHFPPTRPGHGMVGSGLFVIRPPFGLEEAAAQLAKQFEQLAHP
ncbi:ribosomal RNA large subunit methyltransferase J [Roseobacter cerasinus]|uniref:Ribosomal RNA large subunit methyltransferase J n=1 Tax=Roseobacter cerasinus TaxID=2602289 RepID=A0A640VV08_9RHOB|nr:23S rRNA (adenine(2030)-N(6))-methyltransferase RlmJ [Roseobacter cerasinus]GFE51434.1 ribosomal RNA large subunit methyltransferase J [Roseobacter cerasinus]